LKTYLKIQLIAKILFNWIFVICEKKANYFNRIFFADVQYTSIPDSNFEQELINGGHG